MKTGISTAERLALAAKLVTDFTGGTSGATLSLFQNNITPTPATALADFVEATFTGYSRKTGIVSFVTYNDSGTGDQIVNGTVLQLFAATGTPTPQTVYGWYLQDSALAVLLCWGLLDTPYAFNASGDKLEVYPICRLPPSTGQTG